MGAESLRVWGPMGPSRGVRSGAYILRVKTESAGGLAESRKSFADNQIWKSPGLSEPGLPDNRAVARTLNFLCDLPE